MKANMAVAAGVLQAAEGQRRVLVSGTVLLDRRRNRLIIELEADQRPVCTFKKGHFLCDRASLENGYCWKHQGLRRDALHHRRRSIPAMGVTP